MNTALFSIDVVIDCFLVLTDFFLFKPSLILVSGRTALARLEAVPLVNECFRFNTLLLCVGVTVLRRNDVVGEMVMESGFHSSLFL